MRWLCLVGVFLAGCRESSPPDVTLRERYLLECQVHAMMASRIGFHRAQRENLAADAPTGSDGELRNFNIKLSEDSERKLEELMEAQEGRVQEAETALYYSLPGKD